MILPDLTNAEYHARDELGNSQLGHFKECPSKYHGIHVTGDIPKPKSSTEMEDGSIVHATLASEMKEVLAQVTVWPDTLLTPSGMRSTSKGAKEFEAKHPGAFLRTLAEANELQAMVDAVSDEPLARKLLEAPGDVEVSMTWVDPETGVECRCRPDKLLIVQDRYTVLLDWKTTRHQFNEYLFSKSAWELGYHRQAAFYWEGCERNGVTIDYAACVAIGNSPPYNVVVREWGPEEIDLGRREVRSLLDEFADRRERDDWTPRTHGRATPIRFPRYAFTDNGRI